MTIAVDLDVKHQFKQTNNLCYVNKCIKFVHFVYENSNVSNDASASLKYAIISMIIIIIICIKYH